MSDKPHLIEVTDLRDANIILNCQDDLGVPHCYYRDNRVYVEAADYRAWCGPRSAPTSEGQSR
jgi:hypothetical protein